ATTISEPTFSAIEDVDARSSVLKALNDAGYVKNRILSGAFKRVNKEDFVRRMRRFLPGDAVVDDGLIDSVFETLRNKSKVSAMLVDFAFMRESGEKRKGIRRERGMAKGFIPVELFSAGRVDKISDIYSLGLILYEMLALERALPKQDMFMLIAPLTRAKRLHKKLLHRINATSEFTDEIRSLLNKMLAFPMEDRFQSCDELIAALDPIIERLEQEELQRLAS
ncbi:MAG: hypothetical protein ABIA67_05600, partial [Candidatus Margulisiibacteriota bacterium]